MHVSKRVGSAMTHVLRTVRVRIGDRYVALRLVRIGVCFENLGVFPLFLPFLFDLPEKLHKTV